MKSKMVYLDTYILQKDMRVRLPKAVLENLKLTKGVSKFDIYYDDDNKQIILSVHGDDTPAGNEEA